MINESTTHAILYYALIIASCLWIAIYLIVRNSSRLQLTHTIIAINL